MRKRLDIRIDDSICEDLSSCLKYGFNKTDAIKYGVKLLKEFLKDKNKYRAEQIKIMIDYDYTQKQFEKIFDSALSHETRKENYFNELEKKCCH